MKNPVPCAIALALTVSAAAAQVPNGPPATAELIDGWQQADGSRVGAVRITLEPGWKTYWRAPGDAGIPPDFSWQGSDNLDGVAVTWPAPKVFSDNGMYSVGYSDQVTLPITIAPRDTAAPVEINLTMSIGVCKDICIPETLHVRGMLAAQTATPAPIIAAALSERPYTAAEAGARGATCALQPTADGLQITANLTLPSAGGKEHVVIEAGRADIWVSEAKTTRNGDTLTAVADMVPNNGSAVGLDRSAIRFTVLGQSHAVDIRGCTAG